MNQNYRPSDNNPDEMDLFLLFENALAFFNKYKKIILLSPLLGLFCAIILYFSLPKRYMSDLTLKSFVLTNEEQLQIVDNWNKLLKKNEYAVLASDFGCDSLLLSKVTSLSAEEIQKLFLENNPNGFVITAMVKDTSVLRPLQTALINGFENLGYVKEKVSIQKNNFKMLIEKVNTEITKLDSVKSSIERRINSTDKTTSGFIINIGDINSQMIALNEKLLGYKERLQFTKGVQIVQGFTGLMQPEEPKLTWLLLLGVLGGLFISLGISFFLYLQAKLASRKPKASAAP